MLFFKDGFTVYTKGKQTLVAIGVCLVIGISIFLGVRSYILMKRERDTAIFNQSQSQIKFKILESNLAQALNNPPLPEDKLREILSKEYQAVLEKHKQEVLAVVKAQFQLHGNGGGTGSSNATTDTGGAYVPPTKYFYPKQGSADPIMKSIEVNVEKPKDPKFTFELNPITINLQGTLNFDQNKNDGKGSFWMQPTVPNVPGLSITTTEVELTPSPSFQAYLQSIKTGSSSYSVPAKYSVGLMVGREFAKEFVGGYRNVIGFDVTRNFNNGTGLGAGMLGSTGFVKFTYSFGK